MSTKKPPVKQREVLSLDDIEAAGLRFTGAPDPVEAPAAPSEPSTARRLLGDTGVSLLKGAIGVPEAIVGMADLATGGRAGKAAEAAGFRPKDAKQALDELYSPEQQTANSEVRQAQGFGDTLAAALQNPSTIAHAAIESAPSLLPAGVVARGAMAVAPRLGSAVAAGLGEGAVSAGQTAEHIRQETSDGTLNAGQVGLSAGSGTLTALLTGVAGRVANRLGIGDVNQLVMGVRQAGPAAQKNLARSIAEGFATEGVLQELPQSAQEQIAQNLALGKPWDEGVGNAAVMGALAGGMVGGAAAPFGRGAAPAAPEPQLLPETGPMSRAANAGTVATGGQPLEPAPAEDPSAAGGEGVKTPTAAAAPAGDTPVFNTLVLDAKATLAQPGVMDAVRARFGDEGASQLLNSLNQAQNPNVKEAVRKKHLQAVEEAVFWLNAQRVPDEAPQAAIGADAQEALPAPDAPTPAIGMDGQPTGTMRVDSEGVATPETGVDAINTAQAQQVASDEAAVAQETAASIEPQARSASAVYGEGLPRRPAPPINMPERTPRADAVVIDPAGPNAVAQFIAEQAQVNTPAARAFVQGYRAGRITDADVLSRMVPQQRAEPTPDERLAAAAAEAGQVEPGSTPSLILNREGKPFKSRLAASREQQKHAGSQVVVVEGGHAVQPAPVETPDAQIEQPAAEPEGTVASAVQEGADTGGAAAAAAGQPAGAGVEAGVGGAVEADGLTAKSSKAPAIERRERLKAGRSDVATPSSAAAAAPAPAETAIKRRARLQAERNPPTDTEPQAVAGAAREPSKPPTEAEAPVAKQEPASTSQEATAAKEPAAAGPRTLARVGRTPNSAATVELHTNADGTLTPVMEGTELLDFDSGEPITLPGKVTDEEAKAAIRKAGAVSSKQNFYAVKPGEKAAAFSRSEAESPAGSPRVQAVEALVERITSRWKNAPDVVVVEGMDDPRVPQAVRDEDKTQQSQGAEGVPEGFFHDGKVYLVAPQLGGDADVVRVLLHESLGHFGLRGTFGRDMGTILDRVAVLNAGKVRAKAKQYGLDYDKPSERRMAAEEVLAEMAQKAPDVGWSKKAVAAIRTWLREHVPGFRKMAFSDGEIVRNFLLPARAFVQRGQATASSGQAAFSRSAVGSVVDSIRQAGGGPKIIGDTGRAYTSEQLAAMRAVGFQVQAPTIEERTKAFWQDAGKKLAQGLVDQFAPIKEINAEAYSLLRLAKGASGAFEAMLQGGKLKMSDGVYDFDDKQRGGVVDTLLKPLGGEHHDFFRWVAANRAERLLGEGKEHLFTAGDITALKTLADGRATFDYELQHGANAGTKTRDRSLMYADALKTFNGFNKNVLDLAEQSGLIDGESRQLWEHEFYVPFYRVAEEEGGAVGGVNIKGGAVRQQAFKQLKGGKQALNADLMDNTLMNWAHLLDASAKNRAAVATLNAAENMGAAVSAPESTAREMASSIGQKSNVVWVMDGGQRHFYVVEDPYVMTALTSLEYAGMRSPIMKALGSFKHMLTLGVTASPFFKVRNLIRDSVQAIGASPLNYNVAQNLAQGWKLTDPKSDAYFRLLAGGGTIHFGTMLEGSEAKRVQALVESGVDAGTILNSDKKFAAFYRKFIQPSITAYNELGNRGEAINRASLYAQLRQQGMNHRQASLQARDLMDFSMQGSFTSIRFLAQVVPFFNARLQGLYKLGRAAKEDPARISAVIGAAALASITLLLAYSDDDDWKKREEWDRNGYWWFKFGGMAFRIPKPFEVGAIATLAERGFEYAFDKEMTGKRFRSNVLALLGDNLSMNPIPQLAKPLLDVYANKDGMTGRPIESMGMQKLKAEYRFNSSTSMTARGVSTALNAVSGAIGKEALSPVQVDALLRGYFGWLGSFAVGAGDLLARPITDQPTKPDADLFKLATGGMVSDLRDAPSRYVSQIYTQAAEIEKAYMTWKMLVKSGKAEEAAEFFEENKGDIGKHKRVERLKKAEGKLSQQIKSIEQGDDTSQAKRERIRELQTRKDEVARALSAT